jgi:mono/diheme cytochrome c family protein
VLERLPMNWLRRSMGAAVVFCGWVAATADDVQFSRDVQPLLAANCLSCHGSDEEHREADLRLDTFAGATASGAIVPGVPDQSTILERLTSDDPDLRMPPPDTGKSLSAAEVDIVRRWIDQGAEYQRHWSFVPPQRPDVPAVSDDFVRNPVDAFVLQTLRQNGLSPSPAADRATLLRRLSLDITGLPPTIAELDALLSDDSEAAWQTTVDRLLASRHYGEKWGRHWLDAARYADSDGFKKTSHGLSGSIGTGSSRH